MLYLIVLTVFLPVLFWDTWRVSKRWTDLFGILCCIKEDSALCCKGRLLSEQQQRYSGIQCQTTAIHENKVESVPPNDDLEKPQKMIEIVEDIIDYEKPESDL